MNPFHSYSVEFKTYELSSNDLITLCTPNTTTGQRVLVVFNFNTTLKGPCRDLLSNLILENLHGFRFATFSAAPEVASLSIDDFVAALDKTYGPDKPELYPKRVVLIEISHQGSKQDPCTLIIDPKFTSSHPDFVSDLRRVPPGDTIPVIQTPLDESSKFDFFKIVVAKSMNEPNERDLAEEQIWTILAHLRFMGYSVPT
ncbi:MAG TPA: hypothetical protein PLZ57_01845 [Pseudobdellovibrionaceae bacterium]|nr:hypothetical protein [Pseudobdellovibrionaceae bacterium]